ncbi:hypothetical protein OEZ85_000719 [Tetradesmus obliquus]|uniref:Uncharacterized protein n=1 Tax=Tetradesmus obliquus TaxID=3088 RepID=A0ABY8ULF5_TETOB|nr:hypothetical protein OEZ85_000719 [Tetradesmus obliquus]
MAVCKAFKQLLPPLVTHIDLPADWPSRAAAQKALQHVAATFTQLEELENQQSTPLRSLHFTSTNTPKLESINLDQCGEIGGFNLELPELQRLFMEHVDVQDEAGFGSSLSACPKLEMVNCYKLWGWEGRCTSCGCQSAGSSPSTGLMTWKGSSCGPPS